ncbi:hypothetical protein CASFOL_013969 [Castilleja foliolosa]|uniref:RING-type domain-containing protein n=1 Tax=Castilleja foliolosa TaxID=1961234 RepID=A0ABD3DMN8_9LAMI
MAVEARRLNHLPPQILTNRGMIMMNGIDGIGNVYGAPIGYGTETLLPMYGSAVKETFPVKTAAIKSDSGLSYAVPVSRKRSRDAINPMVSSLQNVAVPNHSASGSLTFLGEDFSFQFQQHQLEINRFIAQHTEKVRFEVEERRRRYSKRIAAAVENSVMKRLKAKDEEIEKIRKFNCALEERVKSLFMENQIWRDLAQTNEATANALRSNLEQVLAQVQDQHDAAAFADDAQSSCCSSNFDEKAFERHGDDDDSNDGCIGASNKDRMCRSCGKEESSVLLLPCRHLCLCTLCGSSLQTCPVCNSYQTATVHVNLSPS